MLRNKLEKLISKIFLIIFKNKFVIVVWRLLSLFNIMKWFSFLYRKLKNKSKLLLVGGLLLFTACLSILLVFLFCIFLIAKDLPDHEKMELFFPPVKTRIMSADGYIVAEYYKENRVFIPFTFIPKLVVNAFLAAEDKNFYKHHGIDFFGLIRAIIYNIKNLGNNKRVVGASTITQQVAKNFFLGNQRSLLRKIKEAVLAYRLESSLSKNRILEIYLNQFYFGQGCYGIVSASRKYFNKSVEELTLEEASYLAALVKGANNYHPIRHKERAIERRNWVLAKQLENNFISAEEYNKVIKKDLITEIGRSVINTKTYDENSFIEEVRRNIVKHYGYKGLYEKGLMIRTTQDTKIQALAKMCLQNGILRVDKKLGYRGPISNPYDESIRQMCVVLDFALAEVIEVKNKNIVIRIVDEENPEQKLYKTSNYKLIERQNCKWAEDPETGKTLDKILPPGCFICIKKTKVGKYYLEQIPELQGAILVMNTNNGHVIAMQGGFDFHKSEFNRATQAKRQIGSLIKPFIYLTALSRGMTNATKINASYKVMDIGQGFLWIPRNASRITDEKITLRQGIERSINTATLDIARYAGIDNIKETLRLFDVLDEEPSNISFLLGACETTLLRIATAYAMIANGGYRINPVFIESIQDKDGKCLYKSNYAISSGILTKNFNAATPPIIYDTRKIMYDSGRIYQMISLLEGVVKRHSKTLGVTIAGKTGTSNNSDNLWFVGFSADILVAIYVGYDHPKEVAKWAYGATVAVPIFNEFIKEFYKNKPSRPFKVPPDVEFRFINEEKKTTSNTTEPNKILEVFKEGDDPDFYPEPDNKNLPLLDIKHEYLKRMFKSLMN